MWPFRKKQDLPRFKRDEKGDITFDLTEEEQREVEDALKMFEGYYIRRDIADDFQKGIVAFRLSSYARYQATMSELDFQKENRKKLLEKAIAAIMKAYSIYQLPIYLYDLACFTEMEGRVDAARDMFINFLEEQSEFKHGQIDKLLLEQFDFDINEAIKDEKIKAR